MFLEILQISDTLLRIPFWLFLDSILSARFTGIHKFIYSFFEEIARLCPDCTSIQHTHMVVLFLYATVVCILAVSFHTVGLLVLISLTLGLTTAWIGSIIYALLLHFASSPWLTTGAFVQLLVRRHFLISLLMAGLTFVYGISLCYADRDSRTRLPFLCAFPPILAFLSYLPVVLFLPGQIHATNCVVTTASANTVSATSPAWFAYAHVMIDKPDPRLSDELPWNLFVSLIQANPDSVISQNYHVCPATFLPACVVQQPVLHSTFVKLAPYALFGLYVALILLWLEFVPFTQRFMLSIVQEVELYHSVGFFGFLTFHWNRLNIPMTLAFLWGFKVTLVALMGPQVWTILPDQPNNVTTDMNISFLREYVEPPANQSEIAALLTRIYVGALVHGSETWFVVFGAAAFFSGIATLFVHLLVFLLDPSGEDTRQLIAAAGDAPLNLHDWNVIEDPALALDQNDVLAVEMLAGTSWNCAVVFLFLAFQYDLPSLPLAQRICCSLYGLIVIAISCIHPVQALIKSLLLRLNLPGRDGTSWFSHIRLLFFCMFLIASSLCILTYVPEGLAERVSEHVEKSGIGSNTTSATLTNATSMVTTESDLQSNSSSTSDDPPLILVPRFGSSFESLKARQLRIVLCGCQLLLGLIVTVIEYIIYQISHRYPEWGGFRTSLFWTKLISSVIDYLISLLSFLIVCWLSIYDSIGLCRLVIICCYFYFILYPSATTAYTWLRWRLSSRSGIESMASPTAEQLAQHQDDCPICYTTMTTNNAKVTRCGHFYHTECLATWMRRQLFCPICHADLLSSKVKDQRRADVAAEPNEMHNHQ